MLGKDGTALRPRSIEAGAEPLRIDGRLRERGILQEPFVAQGLEEGNDVRELLLADSKPAH